jgi:hypothetical protein
VDGQAGEADDQGTDAELAGFEFGIDSVAGIVAVGANSSMTRPTSCCGEHDRGSSSGVS